MTHEFFEHVSDNLGSNCGCILGLDIIDEGMQPRFLPWAEVLEYRLRPYEILCRQVGITSSVRKNAEAELLPTKTTVAAPSRMRYFVIGFLKHDIEHLTSREQTGCGASLRIDTNVGLVYVGKFVPKTTVEPDCGSPLRTMRLSVNIVEHNPIVTSRG